MRKIRVSKMIADITINQVQPLVFGFSIDNQIHGCEKLIERVVSYPETSAKLTDTTHLRLTTFHKRLASNLQ